MIKTLLPLLLLCSTAHADWLLHDSAHFGAGVALGASINAFDHFTGIEKDHPLASKTLVFAIPVFAGLGKELVDMRSGGEFKTDEFLATVLGGALAVQLRFTWPI